VSSGPARPRAPWFVARTFVLAAICACGGGNDRDAGVPIDAHPTIDAAWIACAADAGCAGAPLRPVCDTERGACVECLGDGDCERAGSFGPLCDAQRGYCRCERDEDCAGNANGNTCHSVTHACTCLLDGDCANGQECQLEPYLGSDVRTCRQTSEQ
jgi:hypothetical protein